MSFRNGGDISSDERLPAFCVVVPKPLRILSVETYDVGPDVTLMTADFLGSFVQIDRVICLRKQTVLAQLYHTGPLCHVVHQFADFLGFFVLLDDRIEKIVGSTLGSSYKEFLIFPVFNRFWNSLNDGLNQGFLPLGGRKICLGKRGFFNSLTGSHVLEKSSGTAFA